MEYYLTPTIVELVFAMVAETETNPCISCEEVTDDTGAGEVQRIVCVTVSIAKLVS